MTEYIGKDEVALRSLLDDCSSFEERRKIRAAIRVLKEGGVRPHSFHVKPTSSHLISDSSEAFGQLKRPSLGVTRTSSSSRCSNLTEPGSRFFLTSGSVTLPSSHCTDTLARPTGLYSEGDNGSTKQHSLSSQFGSRLSQDVIHRPAIKSSGEPHKPDGSLSNIRDTLNSAFLKTVTSTQSHHAPLSSSVEVRNGVSTSVQESKSRLDLSRLKQKYLSGRGSVSNMSHSSPSYNSNTNTTTPVSQGLRDNLHDSRSEKLSDSKFMTNGSYSGHSPSKSRPASLSTTNHLHGSNEDITRWRSASYSSEPKGDHLVTDKSSTLDDSFIDKCNSEDYLQDLLTISTDFVERRKLRTRIRQLKEKQENTQRTGEEGDVKRSKQEVRLQLGVKKENSIMSTTKDYLQLDYDKIETMEEFKTLLTLTGDPEEKRKIRNAMRQLRRRLEIEKVKLSAGSKVLKSDSSRRQSEDITLHRPISTSLNDARRRLSEDVSKSKFKNILEKKNESSSKIVDLKRVPEPDSRLDQPSAEIQFSVRSSVDTDKSSSEKPGEKKSSPILINKEGTKADIQEFVKTSLTASTEHKQKTSQTRSEEEDFLGRIKARLSTQDKSTLSSDRLHKAEPVLSAKERDSNTDQTKVNITLTRSGGSAQSAREENVNTGKSSSFSRNIGKDKAKAEKSLLAGKLNSSDSRKVKESDSTKLEHPKLITDNKTEARFKSSLSVKLNSGNKGADSKDKLIIGSKYSSDAKKRILPDVDKLNKEKVQTKSGYTAIKKPSQVERSSVFERLSQGKDSSKTPSSKAKDGVELELSSISSAVVKSQSLGDVGRHQTTTTHARPKTEKSTSTTSTTTTTSSNRTILSKLSSSSSQCVGGEKHCNAINTVQQPVVKLTTQSHTADVKALEKYVFRIDLKPKSKGLSRSHSDVLPQTRSWYKKSVAECLPVKPLESRVEMEKAFLDILDDMEHHSTASDTKLSDVSDDDLDVTTNTCGNLVEDKTMTTPNLMVANSNNHIEQSKSWIVLRNVKEDLSAIKFVDEDDDSEEEVTGGQRDAQMDTGQSTYSQDGVCSTDREIANDEENNNVLEKNVDDVTDNLSREVTSTEVCGDDIVEKEEEAEMRLATPDAGHAPMGESAITYQEDEDGTVTVQQVSQTDNQDRVVTVRSKMYRTLSNAQAEERDTVVETNFTSPGGTQLKERDVIRTKQKITSRGSNYYQRSVHVTRRVKDKKGSEVVEQDLCVESDNKSVSKGHSWGNRVVTKVTLDQPNQLQPMIGETGALPKKSHATLVLNKLNVSKVSSGYGSVSGSEEEDREEMVDIKQARPKGCPEITAPMQDMVVREGDAVVMECGAVADPTPTVTWYMGYEQIDSDDDKFDIVYDSTSGKSSLTIHSAMESGHYRCVFRNQHGEAETKTTVTVQKKPEKAPVIVIGLHDLTVMEGHSITLTCTVPDAEIIAWYKDGFVQRHSADFKQSYDGDVARLEIGEVFLDDVGEYACVARNELGEDRSACQITVTACDSETAVVPMFLTQLTSSTMTVGDKLVLECDVIGSPEPDINWVKDGQPIRDDCSLNQMYDGRTAKLEIDDVQIQDSGKYGCVAENEAGRVSSDAIVTVKVRNMSPLVSVSLSDLSSKAGESAVLICQISGFPQPSITWRKNGMLIGQTKDFKQSYDGNTARLEICGACRQDSGRYECVAKNGLGETSTMCNLTVTDTSIPAAQPVIEPSSQSSAPIRRSSTPPKSIIGLALTRSASQKSTHSPLLLSGSPSSPTAAQSIISKALIRSASHTAVTDSPVASPNSPLPSDVIGSALSRSASQKATSSSSSSSPPPQSITVKALDTCKAKPPSQDISGSLPSSIHTQSQPDSPPSSLDSSVVGPLSSKNLSVTESISPSPARCAPTNTIGKFLALAAAKDMEHMSSVPLRTTFESPVESRSTPVTPTYTSDRDITQTTPAKPITPTQHLSKVQQLRLQFLGETNQSQTGKSSNAPIRRWHSLPPQDLRPTVVKREKYLESGGGQQQAIMPSYDDINDEEELMKIMGKTDDFDERKKLRARLKEVREKDKLEREARRQQREKEAGDVVKLKYEKAEEDKKRRMQQFSDMAQKPGTKSTTETKTGDDGSKITTTTTTSSSKEKTDDGGTRTQTVKKTETTVTKTSGMGGVQYAKPGAEETARKLSDHLQTATPPGMSGRISVKTESWNSRDGVVQKSEKTESWGARPGGARGAMAAFKQMDSTNNPAPPNALVTVSLAKKAATTMRRNAIAIKQEVLAFCKHNTQEYQNIEITNFSSCWNNGLAFCALIHHFFPDAFDYKALTPKNRRYNFDLAFDTAEKMADIAPLLDTEDMVRMKNPDWKCVFTYVQSIYRHLREHDANKLKAQEQ